MILEKFTRNKRPSKSYLYKLLHKDIANELKKNEKIGFIDFACGSAQLAIKFNFKSYTGIDTDKKKILINKDNFKNLGIPTHELIQNILLETSIK